MFLTRFVIAGAVSLAGLISAAQAEVIGGVEFPSGSISFADRAWVDYSTVDSNNTGGGTPGTIYQDPDSALGAPDFTTTACSASGCSYVSLGDGGTLIVQFTDNLLTGSGDASDDLWIFEIGPDIEDTFVWIREDEQSEWLSVGAVTGSTRGIDIDSYGYGIDRQFAWVKLQDDGSKDGQSGSTVGADIDAVGAISTVRVTNPPPPSNEVPLPGTLALMGLGMLAIASRKRLLRG